MFEVGAMLQEMAATFRRKVPGDWSLIVQLDIQQPAAQSWHVVVAPGQRVELAQGTHSQAQVIFSLTAETLEQVYNDQVTALTAAGRAHMSDPALLNFRLGASVNPTPELQAWLVAFVQHFFNRSDPERIPLGKAHARLVHGGHAIPLYYHPGFRSAWYLLEKGQRLNKPGDTNPFPQALIFISGQGWARIGEQTVPVRAGESYYIPPGADHVVWTTGDEPLVLIFLAWGAGA